MKRLQRLGYYVTLQPHSVAAVEPATVWDPQEEARGLVENFADLESPALVENELELATNTLPARRKRGRPCKCVERGISCKHLNAASAGSDKSQQLFRSRQ